MSKIRVAVVDDNSIILKKYVKSLEELSDELEVAFQASSAHEFYEKYEKDPNIDALILDIEMEYPEAGLEIANNVPKPVMFTSSYAGRYLSNIMQLKNEDRIVEPIPKDIILKDELFKQKVKLFCKEIHALHMDMEILKLKTETGVRDINASDIVYIAAEKESNNSKVIYLSNDKPITLSRIAFDKIEAWSLQKNPIIKIQKSFMVNKNHIISKTADEVVVKCMDRVKNRADEYAIVEKRIPVSDNYKKNLK